jgi:dihydrofolate reductase/thymidylate synthase
MVAAADEDRGLGKDGELPWKLPGDMAFFKRITSDTRDSAKRNAVIMGRKTWETIPPRYQPLDGRLNAVVTRNADYPVPDGVLRAASIAEALDAIAGCDDVEEVFVIGGGQIYALGIAMPECWRIYLTRVEGRFDVDAFFPPIGEAFELVESSERHEENGIGYVFETWDRVR